MEKYKVILKNRVAVLALYCCLVLIPNVILNFFIEYNVFTNFVMVFMLATEFVAIFHIGKYTRALKNDDDLKRMMIKETDERRLLINAKIGGTGIKVILATVILAMMISGYFSKVVFITLLAVFCFISAVMLALKIYYNKKI